MIIFHADLDNTLIYSYRHDIGDDKSCVEIYDGREISFCTNRTLDLLGRVSEKALVVPTTTRTVEQYNRIDLHMGCFPYVLACNGGVLLRDGQEDEGWYRKSLSFVSSCRHEMDQAMELLEHDEDRTMEVRYVRELFLFTKSSDPGHSARALSEKLDLSAVDIFCNGVKVYVVPKELNKGAAARRLREKVKAETVIAAGDSVFDIPMLEYAEYAIAPAGLVHKPQNPRTFTKIDGDGIFSERVLERVLEIIGQRP